jgi:toxin-antitoxin system PIN domain toxin
VYAINPNILVFAAVTTSRERVRAEVLLRASAEGTRPWALPWPCLYEYLRIVTHPRVYHPSMPVERALAGLRSITRSPSLLLLSETPRHFEILERLVTQPGVTGNLMHDAHIAALCIEHGAESFYTGNRDFARFPGLKTVNPFVAPSCPPPDAHRPRGA